MKKILFFSTCLFLSLVTYAEPTVICPSVEEIKLGNLADWLPLYEIGEELAFDEDTLLFEANVTSFDVAKWGSVYLENGHCYYKGNHPIVQKIVLAQDAWRPKENQQWSWITPNKMAECRGDVANCVFLK